MWQVRDREGSVTPVLDSGKWVGIDFQYLVIVNAMLQGELFEAERLMMCLLEEYQEGEEMAMITLAKLIRIGGTV